MINMPPKRVHRHYGKKNSSPPSGLPRRVCTRASQYLESELGLPGVAERLTRQETPIFLYDPLTSINYEAYSTREAQSLLTQGCVFGILKPDHLLRDPSGGLFRCRSEHVSQAVSKGCTDLGELHFSPVH